MTSCNLSITGASCIPAEWACTFSQIYIAINIAIYIYSCIWTLALIK
jgi:hypothetical protein